MVKKRVWKFPVVNDVTCNLHIPPSAAKTTFRLYLVKRLTVTLRCAENVTTSSFQQFP